MKKTIVCMVVVVVSVVIGGVAWAGTGNLKIILKDNKGITINGIAYAKKGSLVDTCTTSAGTCTMHDLPTGKYTVSAKHKSGNLSQKEIKYPVVQENKTYTVTLILVKKESAGGGGEVGEVQLLSSACTFPCVCVCPEKGVPPQTPDATPSPDAEQVEKKKKTIRRLGD